MDDGLTSEQRAFNEAFDAARAPLLQELARRSILNGWRLARDTVTALAGWQPDDLNCRLDKAEVAASGPHDREPLVLLRWRQWTTRHLAILRVEDLMEIADYENALHLPEEPQVQHWLGSLMLAVYEPHGRPPGEAELWVHIHGLP